MSQAPAAPGSRPLRLDVVTIFPDYLRALDLSLVGKAADTGLIDLHVHDLREWTHVRHRTVDDTPLGGGAGMVMKPDVWGEALDAVLAPPAGAPAQSRRVLVIPAPSGDTFTQRTAEDLARADQVVFACGRYEGIDARVAERDLSIGDYVLSGGEAATLVMIEAVARLRPGVLGNPASVVEESHSEAGLLEYPVHTRPVAWRGLDLAVSAPHLLSGDHARIARARRDQSIARTVARRPDMIERLHPETLDTADRTALAHHGWVVPTGAQGPVQLVIRPACPPFVPREQIAVHIASTVTPERFAAWQADPRVVLTVAELPDGLTPSRLTESADPADAVAPGELVGYSAVIIERPDSGGEFVDGLDPRPDTVEIPARADGSAGIVAELSKAYVDARLRSSGVAAVLLDEAICDAAAMGATALWLGTHERNRRAQKAYKRRGFRTVGSRIYDVGGQACRDVVMSLNPQEVHDEH